MSSSPRWKRGRDDDDMATLTGDVAVSSRKKRTGVGRFRAGPS